LGRSTVGQEKISLQIFLLIFYTQRVKSENANSILDFIGLSGEIRASTDKNVEIPYKHLVSEIGTLLVYKIQVANRLAKPLRSVSVMNDEELIGQPDLIEPSGCPQGCINKLSLFKN